MHCTFVRQHPDPCVPEVFCGRRIIEGVRFETVGSFAGSAGALWFCLFDRSLKFISHHEREAKTLMGYCVRPLEHN